MRPDENQINRYAKTVVVPVSTKRGLRLIYHGRKRMVWGKGVVANNLVFLSGVEARDEKTDLPVRGVKAQTQLALDRVKGRLEEAGTSIDNAVKFVWYVADRALLQEFYEARDGWLAKNAPRLLEQRSYASTLLVVGLARYEMLVEIDCIAVLPNKRKTYPRLVERSPSSR